ncbi:MAG: calcium-binding protein [Pseudomonadota bacterium]
MIERFEKTSIFALTPLHQARFDLNGPSDLFQAKVHIASGPLVEEGTDGGTIMRDIVWTGGDLPANQSTPAVMEVGDSFSSDLTGNIDIDYIRINVQQGIEYEFTIIPTSGFPTSGGMSFVLADAQDNDLWWSGLNYEFEGDRAVYTPTQTGDIWIAVFNRFNENGDYTVSVEERANTSDQADFFATGNAQALTFNSEGRSVTNAVIDITQDIDSFTFETQDEHQYIIRVVGQGDFAPLLSPGLSLYSEGGTQIRTDNVDDRDGTAFTTIIAGGEETLRVDIFSASFAPGLEGGQYQLIVEEIAPEEDLVADDTTTTTVVQAGDVIESSFETGTDQDWYRLEASAGSQLTFTMTASGSFDGELTVYRQGEETLDTLGSGGDTIFSGTDVTIAEFTVDFNFSGTYFVAASSPRETRGDFTISIVDEEVDIAGDLSTSAFMRVNTNANSRIEAPGDADWFNISLEASEVAEFTLISETLGSGTVSLLNIFTDEIVATADITAAGQSVTFNYGDLNAEGYFIIVESASSEGTYSLSVANGDPLFLDEYAGDLTTTGTLGQFQTITSAINAPDEQDWFAVELRQGFTETFTLGTNFSTFFEEELRNGTLTLYDAQGNVVASASDDLINGNLAALSVDIIEGGTYYIGVEGDFDLTGAYTLSYQSTRFDLAEDGFESSNFQFLGSSLEGKVDFSNDLDGYLVDVQAGQRFAVEVEGLNGLDTYLKIEREDGSGFAENNNSGPGTDAYLIYTADTTATYNVAVGSLTGQTGDYIVYLIDIYDGTEADDILSANLGFGSGRSQVYGYGGNDVLSGGEGEDLLDGGAGFDTVSYADGYGPNGVTVNLDSVARGGVAAFTAIDDYGDMDTLRFIEFAIGTYQADTLFGSDRRNTLDGGDGNDILRARSGDDTLIGGAGDDELNGQAGNDTADYSGSTGAIDVDLTIGTADDGMGGTDTLIGIEAIIGSDFDDMFTGGAANDEFMGGEGDDTANGGAGNDILFGGGGVDRLSGGDGTNRLYGEDGNDLIDGGSGTDVIDGGAGDDSIAGGAGGDRIFARDGDDFILGEDGFDIINGQDGNDEIYGGNDRDILRGQAGNDRLFGEDGDDTLSGDIGADILDGGAGTDLLKGGDGDDTLTGGMGDDRLIGGDGVDTAIYLGNIADYDITLRNGVVRITDNVGTDGFDKLTQVEFLQFADGIIDVAGL